MWNRKSKIVILLVVLAILISLACVFASSVASQPSEPVARNHVSSTLASLTHSPELWSGNWTSPIEWSEEPPAWWPEDRTWPPECQWPPEWPEDSPELNWTSPIEWSEQPPEWWPEDRTWPPECQLPDEVINSLAHAGECMEEFIEQAKDDIGSFIAQTKENMEDFISQAEQDVETLVTQTKENIESFVTQAEQIADEIIEAGSTWLSTRLE